MKPDDIVFVQYGKIIALLKRIGELEKQLACINYEKPEDMIVELETENRLLNARNTRLQNDSRLLVQRIVERLEAACGASAMPPQIIRKEFLENTLDN